MEPTTHPAPTVPATPTSNNSNPPGIPADDPPMPKEVWLGPPFVPDPNTVVIRRDGDDPPPDCPELVEDLADHVDDIDMMAHCLEFLVGEIPRLDAPGAERALKRVGRMAGHVAEAASTAALRADAAVKLVRRPRKAPSGDNGNGGANGNGNGHDGGEQ